MNILPPNAKLLFSEEEIERTIDRLAVRLGLELQDESPVFVCVLKGAIPITWDLMRRMQVDVALSYMRVRRFDGMKGGTPQVTDFDPEEFKGKTVVVVDTVLDEGHTLELVREKLEPLVTRLLTVVLVRKQTAYEGSADLIGLVAPDKFLIGRGMDMSGKYRGLPAIYTLED
ncbi:MAG: hypothetical protein F4X44_11815 [Gammaproteobacteria bacterium]|nr:hypothetical protein [Gammaproteobacteria bacterium]MYD81285.1 hypothetical protein [Gammaproteobacteria bacterium]